MPYMPHSDQPTLEDKLSRNQLLDQIVEVVTKCKPPQVLGVHGDWGAGKTSILEQIHFKLTGENRCNPELNQAAVQKKDNVMTIWFDAWQYQNEPVPVVALLQEMRRQFSIYVKARSNSKKLADVTVRSLLYGLDNIAKIIKMESFPVSPEKIQATGEKWEKEHLEDRLAPDTIQTFLQQAIEELLPKKKQNHPTSRLVIIIDDIDRCNSATAYKLLEGLRNYIVLPNCVFILGMNQQIVTDAIGKELGKSSSDSDTKLRAEAYLEKFCSNIWRLPFPKKPATFLDMFLSPGAKELGAEIIAEEERLKIPFLPPNPRRLKALANLLNRMWPVVKDQPKTGTQKLSVLMVAYVYQFHSGLYQRWHYDPNFIQVLSEWVYTGRYGDEHKPFLEGLILPTKGVSLDQEPTPVVDFIGAYPDPTAPGIFWIAPLLQQPLRHLTPADYSSLLRFEDIQ